MDKKVIRKNTKKTVPKKKPIKKTTPKVPIKKAPAIKKEIPEKQNIEMVDCRYCKKDFEKGLTICPHCRKSQVDKTGGVVILILMVILMLSLIGTHFVNLYYDEPVSEADYKYNSVLVSYEELVRNAKEYKNRDIKVIGEVIKVEGVDSSYGNVMTITIDGNLFSGDYEQQITFKYVDKEYKTGFIEGDIVTVYGNYKSINGNVPFIEAEYVVFGS